jgi:6-phosphogluconolactonase
MAGAGGESPGDPGEPRIEVYPDPDATAAVAATRIAEDLAAAAGRRGRADWATTGGSTPVGIYRHLAASPLRERVPWDVVHVWWGDDRFVPRDHPLSNALLLDEVLLPEVRIPVEHVHAIPMGAAIGAGHDTTWVALAYDRELIDAELPIGPNGFPRLDVVLVGVGGDGHVLSDFPGSTAFAGGGWVVAVPAPTHIEPRVARVSLHPGFLEAAGHTLVVAYGAGKAEILAAALGEVRDTARWPIQHARRSNATWLLDAAAASKLPR